MLDLDKIRNELINKNLIGSYCNEIYYDYNKMEFVPMKGDYLINSVPETRIFSEHSSIFEDDSLHVNSTHYEIYMKSGDDEIKISNSKVIFELGEYNVKCIPFKEYKSKKGSLIPLPGENNKVNCRALRFTITSNSTSVSSKEENTYTDYIYNLEFVVGVDQNCYIYIIQTPDVNPPTVLVCRDKMEDLNNITKYVFAGNIYDGIYNSYFHPHQYYIEKHTNYENLVFGSPTGTLNKLKFKEEIEVIDDQMGIYKTNDKLEARKVDGEVDVLLDNYKIASYNYKDGNKVNYTNLDLYKYISDIDLFNSLHDIDMELSIEEFENIDPELQYVLSTIPIDKTEKRIQRIVNDIPIFRLEDYSGDDMLRMVIKFNPYSAVEIMYMINDNEKIYYTINSNEYRLDMFIGTDEFGERVYYTDTKYRAINYSRDIGMISYKENFWVNVDKANVVVNSNLPIIGEKFTKYNVFGVPERF